MEALPLGCFHPSLCIPYPYALAWGIFLCELKRAVTSEASEISAYESSGPSAAAPYCSRDLPCILSR